MHSVNGQCRETHVELVFGFSETGLHAILGHLLVEAEMRVDVREGTNRNDSRHATFGRGEEDLHFDREKRFGILVGVEKHRAVVTFDVSRQDNDRSRFLPDTIDVHDRSNGVHVDGSNEIVLLRLLLFLERADDERLRFAVRVKVQLQMRFDVDVL